MNSYSKKVKEIVGYLLGLISCIIFIHLFKYSLGNDIWYDEVFSLFFTKHNFGEIISLTARDVHPPFYYFYLKTATLLLTSVLGESYLIPAAKIASLIPWIGLFIISITYINKKSGTLTFGLFMFLITVMPQFATYFLEIRMYSLALFLVTSQILLSHYLLTSTGKKNHLQWFLFFVTGILTAYTQYYACIAVIGSYLVLFIGFCTPKAPKRAANLLKLFTCVLFSIVCYIPWLFVLQRQMNNISGKYWIPPLSLRSIAGCIKFAILPVVYYGNLPIISAGLLALSILILTVLFLCKKEKKGLALMAACVVPAMAIIGSGFILSALGTPIFIYRYLVPALGGIWLIVSYMADRVFDKKIFLLLLIPMLMAGYLNLLGVSAEENNKLQNEALASAAVDSIPKSSVIITNFDHVCAIMSYYRPDCRVLLYEGEIDPLITDMGQNITSAITDSQVLSAVSESDNVYFFGSFNSREEIVAAWNKLGIENELLDNILIERYWINIYKLTGEKE